MNIPFHKYQGTGNDFVMIDNRHLKLHLTSAQISKICDRRFGIGADGLILLEEHDHFDFNMNYYNADGSQSFCGNGSRCVVQFAHDLNLINNQASYVAIDGTHSSQILDNGDVSTQMNEVNSVEVIDKDYFINTGSPHYIIYTEDLDDLNILKEAHVIRYNHRFKKEGVNVNFLSEMNNEIHIRTYERGVEGETLSCGTGVTAAAIAHCFKNKLKGEQLVNIQSKGGKLMVKLNASNNRFRNIELIGPAKFVYKGELNI